METTIRIAVVLLMSFTVWTIFREALKAHQWARSHIEDCDQ